MILDANRIVNRLCYCNQLPYWFQNCRDQFNLHDIPQTYNAGRILCVQIRRILLHSMLSFFNWKSESGALFRWGYHSYSNFVQTYLLFSPDYSTLGKNDLCFYLINTRGVYSCCNAQVCFCGMTVVQIRENSATSKVLPTASRGENLLEVTLINLDPFKYGLF